MTLPALLTKVDRRSASQDITNEAHVIGEDTANFVFLVEIPREDGESTVSIPGYSEVSGAPDPSEFLVYYTDRLAGAIEFHGDDDADSIQVTYKGLGSSLFARDLNNVHEWLEEHIAPDTGIITATIFDGPLGTGAATPAAIAGTTGTFSGNVSIGANTASAVNFTLKSNRTTAGQTLGNFEVDWDGTTVAKISVFGGTDDTDKDEGVMNFRVAEAGGSLATYLAMSGSAETLTIKKALTVDLTSTFTGDFTIGASKLVITASTGAVVAQSTITATDFIGAIGGTTPAAGTFTDLGSSGACTLDSGANGSSFGGTLAVAGAVTTDGGLQTFGDNDSGGSGFRQVLVPNV